MQRGLMDLKFATTRTAAIGNVWAEYISRIRYAPARTNLDTRKRKLDKVWMNNSALWQELAVRPGMNWQFFHPFDDSM
jgi:hypothetical protein